MRAQNDLLLEFRWYWEGPIGRYYMPTPKWRSSREMTLWHLSKGTVELLWEKGRRTVTPGHWIVPPPLRRNERFSPDAEIESFRFRALSRDGRMLLCPEKPLVYSDAQAPALASSIGEICQWLRDELQVDLGYKTPPLASLDMTFRRWVRLREAMAAIFGALLDVVEAEGDMPQAESAYHPAVAAALLYMEQRNLAQPLREKDLARHTGISLPHLRRLFREEIGMPLKAWDADRLESSIKQALRSGAESCKEIAYAHGFSSASHFSLWFRRTQGCTPSDWLARKISDDVV